MRGGAAGGVVRGWRSSVGEAEIRVQRGRRSMRGGENASVHGMVAAVGVAEEKEGHGKVTGGAGRVSGASG